MEIRKICWHRPGVRTFSIMVILILMLLICAGYSYAGSQAGDQSENGSTTPPPQSSILFDLFSIIITLGFLVGGLYLATKWFRKRVEQNRFREEEQFKLFQEKLEREFGVNPPQCPPVKKTHEHHLTPKTITTRNEKPIPLPPAPKSSSDSPVDVEISPDKNHSKQPASPDNTKAKVTFIISKMKDIGLFVSEEGPHLALDPSGETILVRIKNNRTVLIVPRYESEHFLNNAIKRFDFVIMIFHDSSIHVMSKFQDFLVKDISFG